MCVCVCVCVCVCSGNDAVYFSHCLRNQLGLDMNFS